QASAMLASAYASLGDKALALAAIGDAAISSDIRVQFLIARAHVESNALDKAVAIADKLAARPEPEPRHFAKLVQAEVQLARGNARDAIGSVNEAMKIIDTWLDHYDLALAYLQIAMYL